MEQITTLIPAYKPKYLGDLLLALRQQTVKPARIIVSDDSPDQAFIRALETSSLKDYTANMNVEVIVGPRTGAFENFCNLLKRYQGETELYHFLLDDDVIYPNFYERHLEAHARSRTECVVSGRWYAVESGQPVGTLDVPSVVARHPDRVVSVNPEFLFATSVATGSNWLGEFSNATFRADMATEFFKSELDGLPFAGLEDIGAFLVAAIRSPIAYINEQLGCFRMNPGQQTEQPMSKQFKCGHLAWVSLAIAARRGGWINKEQCQTTIARVCSIVLDLYGREADMAQFCVLLSEVVDRKPNAEERFLRTWGDYIGRPAGRSVPPFKWLTNKIGILA
ncbi:glycosyltransferase [Oxalobacteraceae bacterium OM1]|nr:glycosyltransferase [Oxalobacteraceae bacterium OM1]